MISNGMPGLMNKVQKQMWAGNRCGAFLAVTSVLGL